MNKDTLYNQVNPLVRVKESELITKAQWQAIRSTNSIESLRQILSGTDYASDVRQKNFYETFEQALNRRRGEFFSWLYSVAPEEGLVDSYTLRYTFHNLKVLTKGELTGQNLDHLFLFDGRFTIDMMKSAVKTQASSILPDYLLEGIHEVMEYFEEGKILQGIDIIYDRLYLTEIKKISVDLGYPELIEEVEGFIDLVNIAIMSRGLAQKQTVGFLTTVLSSSGSIPKSTYLSYANTNLKQFTSFVLSTSYRSLIEPIVSNGEINLRQLPSTRDEYLTRFYMSSKTMAFGPLPLLALMNAKEVEEKNLRLYVNGLANGFSKEVLKERTRDIDAL